MVYVRVHLLLQLNSKARLTLVVHGEQNSLCFEGEKEKGKTEAYWEALDNYCRSQE